MMKSASAPLSALLGILSVIPFLFSVWALLVFLPIDVIGFLLGIFALRDREHRIYALIGTLLCSLSITFKLLVFIG